MTEFKRPSLADILDIGGNPLGLFFVDSQTPPTIKGDHAYSIVCEYDPERCSVRFIEYIQNRDGHFNRAQPTGEIPLLNSPREEGEPRDYNYHGTDLVWCHWDDLPLGVQRHALIHTLVVKTLREAGMVHSLQMSSLT